MKITAYKMVRPSVDQDRNSLIFDSSQTNIVMMYALSLTCGNIAGDQFRVQGNCPPTSPKPTLTLTSHLGTNVG